MAHFQLFDVDSTIYISSPEFFSEFHFYTCLRDTFVWMPKDYVRAISNSTCPKLFSISLPPPQIVPQSSRIFINGTTLLPVPYRNLGVILDSALCLTTPTPSDPLASPVSHTFKNYLRENVVYTYLYNEKLFSLKKEGHLPFTTHRWNWRTLC